MYDKSKRQWTITNMAKVRNDGLSDNAATTLHTAVTMKATVLCDMWPRDVAEIYRRFGGSYRLHLQGVIAQVRATFHLQWTCHALRRIVSYLPIDMVRSRRHESKTVIDMYPFPIAQVPSGPGPYYGCFTIRRNTPSRTPLDEGSANCKNLHLTTYNTHKRHTFNARDGIRTSSASQQASDHPLTHANENYATAT
jgi:hypothetical protein